MLTREMVESALDSAKLLKEESNSLLGRVKLGFLMSFAYMKDEACKRLRAVLPETVGTNFAYMVEQHIEKTCKEVDDGLS